MMEIDVDEVEEVDGSSGGVRGALQLLLCLLDPGGTPGFDSGDGGANVDGEVAELDQREVVSEVVCSNRRERVGFYSLEGVLRIVIHDDGEHGALDDQRCGRGQGGGQGVLAIITIVLAQGSVVKHSRQGHALVIVHGDGRRAARRL